MSDKLVEDWVVLLGHDVNPSLESFKLFTLVDTPKPVHGSLLCSVKARDVGVRRSGGWFFSNFVMGRENVVGGLDLDKVRSFPVSQELFLQLKFGKPGVFLAFPDRFEQLPESLRNHKDFGMAFQLIYMRRQNLKREEEALRDIGINESEIRDRLTQSNNLITNQIFNTVKNFNEATMQNIKNLPKNSNSKGEDDDESIFNKDGRGY